MAKDTRGIKLRLELWCQLKPPRLYLSSVLAILVVLHPYEFSH